MPKKTGSDSIRTPILITEWGEFRPVGGVFLVDFKSGPDSVTLALSPQMILEGIERARRAYAAGADIVPMKRAAPG